ncbi:MAG: hypothetical protein KC503_08875 [Myxococcales bacterium]|nr:hypothetical protein [Myxococcales bacterium]
MTDTPSTRRRRKALLVALGATLTSIALAYVPLPTARALVGSLTPQAWPNVGLLALGLTPLLAAFQLVELAALAVPRWRALRIGDAAARAKLTRVALFIGFAIAAVQAYSVVVWIESYHYSQPGLATRASFGWGPRLYGMGLLLLGVALLVLLAALIRRYGLGEGYSWILVGSLTPSVGVTLISAGNHVSIGQRKPIAVLVEILVLVALFVAARRYLRDSAARAHDDPLRPREPTAGILPPAWAVQLLMLPVTLANLANLDLGRIGLGALFARLTPGTPFYTGAWLSVTAGVSLVLSRLFLRPHNVARGFAELGVAFDGAAFAERRRAAVLRSTLLVCTLPLLSYALSRFVTGGAPSISLVAVVVAAAVFEDIAEEWRGRRILGGIEEPLLSMSRVYRVAPARARLRERGIDCFVRGAHHRTLLSFFGPFIPITLFVRARDVNAAREALAPAATETPVPAADR